MSNTFFEKFDDSKYRYVLVNNLIEFEDVVDTLFKNGLTSFGKTKKDLLEIYIKYKSTILLFGGKEFTTTGIVCDDNEKLNYYQFKCLFNSLNHKIMSLQNTIKKVFRSEPEKTFVEVGFLDENENVTETGKEALLYLLWKEKKDELKKLADTIQEQEKINR